MPLTNPYSSDEELSVGDYLAGLPRYIPWASIGFLKSWWQTRELSQLVQGVPAIVLGAVLVMLFLTKGHPVSSDIVQGYLQRAQAATANEQYEQADFYFKKLESLAPKDREVVHEHALLHAKQGNYFEAFKKMRSLTSDEDRSNDVEVNLWLAKTAMTDEPVEAGLFDRQQAFEFAKERLNAVLEDDPKELYAHYFFSQVFLKQGDITSAIEHLQHVAAYSSELQLLLAALYDDQGETRRAESHASNAVKVINKEIQETQVADAGKYHQLATGYGLLRKYPDAIRTLDQARTKFDQQSTRLQLARMYVIWSDDVAQTDPSNVGRRIKLLEQALMAAPDEPMALLRLLSMATTDEQGAAEAEAKLRETLVDGVAPATAHFCLGSLAAARGDDKAALRHFTQSAQLNPRTAVTLNNMAYLMAHAKGADYMQALALINQALNMQPNTAAFRDTRGQVLVRLGRHQEAIPDLEYALQHITETPTLIAIRRALATAYDGVGDQATAEGHRRKLKELIDETGGDPDRKNAPIVPEIDFKEPVEADKNSQ